MADAWKQWEGQTVGEKFSLLRFLGGSEGSAVFLTERDNSGRVEKAAIKFIPSDPKNDELRLSHWRETAQLSHPNLIALHETGRFELGGLPYLYVVMECAEENLAQVLIDRALTADETRAALEPVLSVIGYLHAKGLVHGHIKPANIMANGDQMKVSSDALRRAGEPIDFSGYHDVYHPPEYDRGVIPMPKTFSPAGDVWSLGMTLVEALTQSAPVLRTPEGLNPLVPETLPDAFLEIATHCLVRHPQGRWTIAQIVDRLKGQLPQVDLKATPAPASVPMPPQESAPRAEAHNQPPRSGRRRYELPFAVIAVLALIAIIAGPRLWHRDADVPQAPADRGEPSVVPPAPSQAAPTQPAPDRLAPNRQTPSQAQPIRNSAKPSDPVREEQSFKTAPVPVPASIHPEAKNTGTNGMEETNAVANRSVETASGGEVIHQVIPEVSQSARNTIHGTVRVNVKVSVDSSGNVRDAALESPASSRYFDRTALEAARLWKFQPSNGENQNRLDRWTLRFAFQRDHTSVVPSH